MGKEETKDYFKEAAFKPSIQVNKKQIILIIVILLCIASIPIIYSLVKEPGQLSKLTEMLNIKNEETNNPFTITIPILNTDIDLTVIKQNPQLLIYAGGIFVFLLY